MNQKVKINYTSANFPILQEFIEAYETMELDDFVNKYQNVDYKFLERLRYQMTLLNIEIKRIFRQMVKHPQQTQL